MHRIRKGQFNLGDMATQGQTTPEIWETVFAALVACTYSQLACPSSTICTQPLGASCERKGDGQYEARSEYQSNTLKCGHEDFLNI